MLDSTVGLVNVIVVDWFAHALDNMVDLRNIEMVVLDIADWMDFVRNIVDYWEGIDSVHNIVDWVGTDSAHNIVDSVDAGLGNIVDLLDIDLVLDVGSTAGLVDFVLGLES